MTEDRLRYIRNLDSLAPLSDHTNAIEVDELGKVQIAERLPAPNDQYGIPRPELMIDALLSVMKTENYVWTGRFDEHHLATPKADFTVIRTADQGNIGSAFRGLSCLKIDLPRQMHNFSHALFELPGRPSLEVMRQAVTEVGYAKQLQSVFSKHFTEYEAHMSDRSHALGMQAVMAVIEAMDEPKLDLLPPREELAGFDLEELRRTVNALLRVRHFSDKKLIHPAVRTSRRSRQLVTRDSVAMSGLENLPSNAYGDRKKIKTAA